MRLEPVNQWMLARAILHKRPGTIVLANTANKVTRCYLIEEVGPDAKEKGYKVGDIIVARLAHDMFFHGGSFHRVVIEQHEIVMRVHDVTLDEFSDIKGNSLEASTAEEQRDVERAQQRAAEAS